MSDGRVPLRHWVLFWAIALGGTAFDLGTKAAVFARVGPPGSPSISIVPDILDFRTSHNTGALWGWGRTVPHSSLIFAVLSILAAAAICYWLFARRAATDWRLTTALALIWAGAMGNCHDRLVFGYVRDFVYFHIDAIDFHFAIFNFADNMLVAGAAILMFLALRPEPLAEPAGAEPTTTQTSSTSPDPSRPPS